MNVKDLIQGLEKYVQDGGDVDVKIEMLIYYECAELGSIEFNKEHNTLYLYETK